MIYESMLFYSQAIVSRTDTSLRPKTRVVELIALRKLTANARDGDRSMTIYTKLAFLWAYLYFLGQKFYGW